MIPLLAFGFALAAALGVLAAAPLAAEAQQARQGYRIGVLHVGDHVPPAQPVLRDQLRALGYEDGQNLRLDVRNLPDEGAAGRAARELADAQVDVIVAFGDPAVRAARAATARIPVVMVHVSDPVAQGFVSSLARPGHNLTGFVFFAVSPAKHVELLKEMVPELGAVLVLIDPRDPTTPGQLAEIRKAASALNIRTVEREASDRADLERVFASIIAGDIGGVVVASNTLHIKHTVDLIRLAAVRRAPLASYRTEAVAQGALFSYAPDTASVGRRAAAVVDRILKGGRPSDIPVEQPREFELVISLRTARTLGLTIPPAVLVRAHRVIE